MKPTDLLTCHTQAVREGALAPGDGVTWLFQDYLCVKVMDIEHALWQMAWSGGAL